MTVDGADMLTNPRQAKQKIGYLPKEAPLYCHMSVAQHLEFFCALRHMPKAQRAASIAMALERLKLKDKQGCLIKNLSRGDRQKTALAGVLCTQAQIMILDEPTAGLDPGDVTQIRSVLRETPKTLIVATSNIQEVTALCDKVIIMHEGRIVAQDALESFTHAAGGKKRLSVRLMAGRATGLALLKNIDGVDIVECVGSKEPGTFDYIVDADEDVRAEIFRVSAKAGIVLLGLKTMTVTLEDVFYQLTCQSGGMAV